MDAQASVTFVDVGQGNCAVVADLAKGTAAIIDCPEGKAELALAHLAEQSIREVSSVIATHNDLDHFGGVYELAERSQALEVRFNHGTVVPADPREALKLTAALRAIVELTDRGVALRSIREGERGRVGAIEWEALAPDHALITIAQGRRRPNDASVVLRCAVAGRRFLFTGDAGDATWRKLLAARSDLSADVLLVPHHGADFVDPALLAAVLDAVRADFLVVSVGTTNRYGHPSERLLRDLGGRPGRLMCTQVNATCLGSAQLPIAAARRLPAVSRIGAGFGSQRSCPCAGSIRFVLNENAMTVTPSVEEHRRVKSALGCPLSG